MLKVLQVLLLVVLFAVSAISNDLSISVKQDLDRSESIVVSWRFADTNFQGLKGVQNFNNEIQEYSGFNIYRSENKDLFIKLNVELLTGNVFVDESAVFGVSYKYYVAAVNDSGEEIYFSPKVSRTIRNSKLFRI